MVRQQVLKLYKDTLKTISRVPDTRNRIDLRDWARTDYKLNKTKADEVLNNFAILLHFY
jgi:Complex 1 protein (LYR family)